MRADTAAHNWAPRNPPLSALCKAPPIGGPVSAANDNALNAIPNQVPNMFMLGVMAATVDGIKH